MNEVTATSQNEEDSAKWPSEVDVNSSPTLKQATQLKSFTRRTWWMGGIGIALLLLQLQHLSKGLDQLVGLATFSVLAIAAVFLASAWMANRKKRRLTAQIESGSPETISRMNAWFYVGIVLVAIITVQAVVGLAGVASSRFGGNTLNADSVRAGIKLDVSYLMDQRTTEEATQTCGFFNSERGRSEITRRMVESVNSVSPETYAPLSSSEVVNLELATIENWCNSR